MKRNSLIICILCSLLCVFVGCKNDKDKEPESFVSDMARPTWTIIEDYDYASSMTAVVKVDLAEQYPDKAAEYNGPEPSEIRFGFLLLS